MIRNKREGFYRGKYNGRHRRGTYYPPSFMPYTHQVTKETQMNKFHMGYDISISEPQRTLFVQIMEHALKDPAFVEQLKSQKCGDEYQIHANDAFEELEALLAMTKDLPRVESEHPGVLHGFCL